MRRDVLRFSGLIGLILLLSVVLTIGCTRSKSSGPPEPDDQAAQGATTPETGEQPQTTPLSGDAAMNATMTALAATATAQVGETPQSTEATSTPTPQPSSPTDTPTPESTESPESTKAVEPSNTPESTKASATTQPPTSAGDSTHVVKAGENLFRIALNHGLTYQRLAAYNGIANPNFIVVGQKLKIPGSGEGTTTTSPTGEKGYHTVQQGENLFRVALKYNMLYTVLAKANGLSYPYTIYPGQRLVIP